MKYQCEVKEAVAQPVLSIRRRAAVQDLPAVIGEVYAALGAYLGELGEVPVDAPFVAYYNMDMQDLDLEIGIPVTKALPAKGEIEASFIPGGKQVSCMHIGAYSQVEPAYEALMKYVQENGYEATGVSYEFYLNDPATVAEAELQTRIVFPLV